MTFKRFLFSVFAVALFLHSGCIDWSKPETADFAWRNQGGRFASKGFGISLAPLPQDFITDAGKDWGDIALLTAYSEIRKVTLLLHVHQLADGESLPAFSREFIKFFGEGDVLLSDVQHQKLEGEKFSGWQVSFFQQVGEEDHRRWRLLGMYARGDRVFVVAMDTPEHMLDDNREFMETIIRSFEFLGNPDELPPTLEAVKWRYQWYQLGDRLVNDGYLLSLPFDYDTWKPAVMDFQTSGGVVLHLQGLEDDATLLVEMYSSKKRNLADLANTHSAALSPELGFGGLTATNEKLGGELPAILMQAVRFQGTAEAVSFSYLYFIRGEHAFICSTSLPMQSKDTPMTGAYLLRAIRLYQPGEAPHLARKKFFRGYAHFMHEESAEAHALFRSANGLTDERLPHVSWGMGITAFKARDLSNAAKYLREAVGMEEKLPPRLEKQSWQHLGMAELDLGNPNKARAAFEEWAKLEPESPLPPIQLARVAGRLKDEQAARQALELARQNALAADGRERTNWFSAMSKLLAVDPELQVFADKPWFQEIQGKRGIEE